MLLLYPLNASRRIMWKKRKILLIMPVLLLSIFIGYKLIEAQSIIRDGEVLAGLVRIKDDIYRYTSFESVGRKKKIAEIDNWSVYEIKEDPKHIFLQLKSFTGEQYIVREDYQIPTEGKVNCVYVDGHRLDNNEILETFDKILTTEYYDGTGYYLSESKDEQKKWKHFIIGYEDCPVGTDNSIYGIAKIDSRWVVLFSDDIGENDGNGYQVTYYEVSPECANVFEESMIWENPDA